MLLSADVDVKYTKTRNLEIVSNTQKTQTTLKILFILSTIGFVLYNKYHFIFFKLGVEDL